MFTLTRTAPPIRSTSPSTLTAACTLAAAGLFSSAPAMARPVDVCNPALPYTMPDHDQRRNPGPGVVGLPNNGSQYCVPTCTMDILTYLQNHGYPGLDAGPGPGPWLGTQPVYNAFSNSIDDLGDLMNTDPFGGTGGTDAFAGVNDWIDNAGMNGDIIVTMMGTTISNAPELGDIAFALLARCPISISVGWYSTNQNGFITRNGGHCVAVNRLPDFCSGVRKLSIRDPGSSVGSNNLSQAVGTTETYNIQTQNVLRIDGSDVIYSGPYERIMGYASGSTSAYIDGYRAFTPAFGLAACNNPVNGSCVTQHMPSPSFTGLPQTTHFDPTPGATTLDLDIRADNLGGWALQHGHRDQIEILSFSWGATQTAARSYPALAPFNSRAICSGSDPRTLFLLDTNPHLIVRLNTATGVATPMSLADPATAICFDAQTREVVAFSSAARRITRINPATLAPVSTRTLPASVIVGPEPRIAASPVGGYLWLTSGETTGSGLVYSGESGGLVVAATISGTQALRGVDTDDRGHVFTTSGGQTLEFEPPHATTVLAWARVEGGRFGSLADGPIFRIAKSRNNYERAIHDSPGETLAMLPTTFAPSVPDCKADFNLSGSITVQDLFDFLAAYFESDAAADFNESSAVTVQDIFDYLAAYFAGCP